MAERVVNNPRELSFYGEGKADDINRGFAITSLRRPREEYNFAPGERILADCKDDGEKISVIVISNVIREVQDHPTPVLAMDGFFNTDMVIEGMSGYPGYEAIDETWSMSAIVFVKEDSFLALPEDLQKLALGRPIEENLKSEALRHLFFPTMAFWATEYGAGLNDWISYLQAESLIHPEEAKEMKQYKYLGSDLGRRMIAENSKILQELSRRPEVEAFEPLILGVFHHDHSGKDDR